MHLAYDFADCIGICGLDYILSCLISDIQLYLGDGSWQNILGRLCVLEKVFSDFPDRFTITDNCSELEKGNRIECLVSIATCVSSYLNNPHTRVCKIAKKISVNVAKILVTDTAAFGRLWEMMRTLESREVGVRMQRRLQKILDDYERALEEAERAQADYEHERRDGADCCGDQRDGRRNGMRVYYGNDEQSRTQGAECSHAAPDRGSAETPSNSAMNEKSGACPGSSPHVDCTNGCTNISDVSDLSASPTTPMDNPITFKSEVASSPRKKSGVFDFSIPGVGSKNCKDKVEAEEAEALAIAMEASMHTQCPLPKLPGLNTKKNGDVIVHVQYEVNHRS